MSLAPGPIFWFEMTRLARWRNTYLFRFLYGGFLLLVMASMAEVYRERNFYFYRTPSQAMMALAESVFYLICWTTYILAWIGPAVVLGPAIAAERQRRTLEFLLQLPLTDREIVLDKLWARGLTVAGYLAVAVPIAALAGLGGGVSYLILARVAAVSVLAIFVSGSLALWCSVHRPTGGAAVGAAIGMLLRIWVLIPLVTSVAFSISMPLLRSAIGNDGPDRNWINFIEAIMTYGSGLVGLLLPYLSMTMAFWPTAHDFYESSIGAWYFEATFIAPVLFSIYALRQTVLALRPSIDSVKIPVDTPRRTWREWWRKKRLYPAITARRWREVDNPVWQWARARGTFDSAARWRRLCYAGLALYAVTFVSLSEYDWLDLRYGQTFVVPCWYLLIILAAFSSATSIYQLRQDGLMEELLVTPISAYEYITGFVAALLETLLLPMVILLVMADYLCLRGVLDPQALTLVSITGLGQLTFASLIGVLVGLRAKSQMQAAGILVWGLFCTVYALGASTGIAHEVTFGRHFYDTTGSVWISFAINMTAGLLSLLVFQALLYYLGWAWAFVCRSLTVLFLATNVTLFWVGLASEFPGDFWKACFSYHWTYAPFASPGAWRGPDSPPFMDVVRDSPWPLYASYWLALAVAGAEVLRSGVRHFDRLVGRHDGRRTVPPPLGGIPDRRDGAPLPPR